MRAEDRGGGPQPGAASHPKDRLHRHDPTVCADYSRGGRQGASADYTAYRGRDGRPLNEYHAKMLAASAITAEHAQARGYETIIYRWRLGELGIAKAARNCVPGLLVPMLRIDGSTWGYQYRPDVPRWRQDRIVKYETPYQQRNGVDVPPGVADWLGDPSVPLWVTEGVKKADCGAHYGLCIVALPGVWSWMGTNTAGGKVALPDWRDIALNNRRVILAFDGDVARKESVQKALHALADYLAIEGANVEYLWLPDTDGKTGLDDYLVDDHTVDDLLRLVKPDPPPVAAETPGDTGGDRQPPESEPEPVQPISLDVGPRDVTPGGTDNKSYDQAAGNRSSSNGRQGIDFGELLIGILHHGHGDSTSVCWWDGSFHAVVKSPREAIKFAQALPQVDTWFGVNPVSVLTQGRGKAEDVRTLCALWADLDFKETGCKTPEIALKVVEDLSAILGIEPVAITETGHGLQPYWRVYCHDKDHTHEVTLRRWGRLVAAVADKYGAKVDNVFDLPRILRMPGTYNCKNLNGQGPIPVVTHRGGKKFLSLHDVDKILEAHGVFAEPEDTHRREQISKPAGWEYGPTTCPYVIKIINAIATDTPKAGRHQWMVSQCVKLVSAARLGCISEADFGQAAERLYDRLVALRDETGEEVPSHEVPSAMNYAGETVSCKTDEEVRAELGNHEHRTFAHSAPFADGVGPSDEDLFDGDPIPLTQPVHIPDFPVDEFPKTYSDMISGVSGATQTDPAMAGTSALAALAAATAGRVDIEVRSGWTEPLCLYLAAIAHSGQRKSSVHKQMTRPIQEVEDRLAEEARPGRVEAVARKQVAEHLVARLTRAAANDSAGATEMAAAIQAAQDAAAIEVPPIPRLVADDVTPEKAGSLLAEQGGRIAIISAEGGIFDIMAGRYNKGIPNLDLWNKAHAGDPLKVDRQGRESESVPRPAMTLGLMIQPAVLSAIASKHEFRGTGLLARFLYAYPESKVGRRQINPAPVSKEVRDSYTTALSNLTYELAGMTGPITLTLTEEAHKEVVAIETALEPSLAADEELGSLADWGSKYVGAIARIAGILHLAEHGMPALRRQVTKETISSAARIGEYYKACAITAFAEMGADPVTADAVYLLERAYSLNRDEVSERDLFNHSRRFKKMADLKPAVARLVDHRHLAPLPVEKTGGRPASPVYKVRTPSAKGAEGAKVPPPDNPAKPVNPEQVLATFTSPLDCETCQRHVAYNPRHSCYGCGKPVRGEHFHLWDDHQPVHPQCAGIWDEELQRSNPHGNGERRDP